MKARSRWLATAVSAVLASSVLGVVPVVAQDDGFDFEPLLMPFPAGEGRTLPGSTLHTGGDSHAVDLCAGEGCKGGQIGDRVLAPTDLTYDDLSISTNDDDTDALDFHFFEIANNTVDRLCMSLGHFDLSEPGTLVDGKRTYQQGERLGTLLDFPTVPHVHMGLYTVPAQSRCNSKQRYLDPVTDELRGRTAVAFEGEFAIEGLPVDGSAGSAVTSTNGPADPSSTDSDSAPGDVAPPVQWIEPVDGAAVGVKLKLAAWPTPVLVDGQLTDPTDVTRVDFTASWSGGSAPACSASSADAENLWSCTADLVAMGVPAGPVDLTFDVLRTDGSILTAPDGSETVTYAASTTPKVVWVKRGTTKDASHVPYGEPVTLTTRFHGDVDVAEVRFTAFYPDWPNAKDAAKLKRFDPKATWRTLKVCRPKTKGCSWDGDRQAATVSYAWDPTVGEKKRSVKGVPKAQPAVSPKSKKCVPVTLGIDAVDDSGTITSAPGGKIAQRCDAKASGLARTVYLDPLAPPAAPGSVVWSKCTIEHERVARGVRACVWMGSPPLLGWQDRSTDEAGFRVYVREVREVYPAKQCRTVTRKGGWVRVATLSADTESWRFDLPPNIGTPEKAGEYASGFDVEVRSFNRAGESGTRGVWLSTEDVHVPPERCW